jgi:arginine deiminase
MTTQQISIYIDSEVLPLKHVFVHTPGSEVKQVRKENFNEFLYNAPVNPEKIAQEHSIFKNVLKHFCTVWDVTDLIDISFPPLPNLYFTRDISFVWKDKAYISRMAYPIRALEAKMFEHIYTHHPFFKHNKLYISHDISACYEGGDILITRPHVLCIGISERTRMESIEILYKNSGCSSPLDVLCVELPLQRSTIHLDMIFTWVSLEQAVVYEPYVLGKKACPVWHKQFLPNGHVIQKEYKNLFVALKALGIYVSPILCGNGHPQWSSYEQANSGANLFALNPQCAVSYDMHEHTLRACENAGFRICGAEDFLKEKNLLKEKKPLIITLPGQELSKGGGGPRCMTCPLQRAPWEQDSFRPPLL